MERRVCTAMWYCHPTPTFPAYTKAPAKTSGRCWNACGAHMDIDPSRVDREHDEADENPELRAFVPIHMSDHRS
jgi:hypothetical protein